MQRVSWPAGPDRPCRSDAKRCRAFRVRPDRHSAISAAQSRSPVRPAFGGPHRLPHVVGAPADLSGGHYRLHSSTRRPILPYTPSPHPTCSRCRRSTCSLSPHSTRDGDARHAGDGDPGQRPHISRPSTTPSALPSTTPSLRPLVNALGPTFDNALAPPRTTPSM